MTLKAGVRDENGLESIDGIFSSPEKSPAKVDGLNQISTISEGESMDIGQSETFFLTVFEPVLLNEWLISLFVTGTNLDPTEVIGRARNGKNFLPPRSRSPMKTNIGSSPRRSLGPISSPSRILNGVTPTRPMSHPPESSRFDMSREELTPSIEGSDKKGRKLELKNVRKLQINGKGKKRAFDLSNVSSESDEDERNSIDMNGANETNGGGFNESALVENEDEAQQTLLEDITQSGEQDLPSGGSEGEITEVMPEPTNTVKRRGRPKPTSTDPSASQDATSGQKQVREKPSKKAKKDVNGDENIAQEESSEAAVAADQEAEEATPKKRKGPETTISERDPNAKMKPPPRPTGKSSLTKPKGTKTERGRPKLASHLAVRSATPANDDGALRMKSGRTSIKPVAFWRGERIIYGDGNIEGQVLTLPSIKEVIRTDDIVVPRPKQSTYRRGRAMRQIKDEPEEEDERAPWEIGTGIVRAQVMQWDPAIGKYDEENTEEAGEHCRTMNPDEPH